MSPDQDAAALWVEARVAEQGVTDWPAFGSAAWCALPPRDPRRYAAVLEAAETWRREQVEKSRLEQLAEADPAAWWAEVTEGAETEARRTLRRLEASRRPTWDEIRRRRVFGPIHELRATPDWPPIAIPGEPGRYLTAREAA